ncbi:MAG: M15 family metallopeptidase [Aeromicrobium sp.]
MTETFPIGRASSTSPFRDEVLTELDDLAPPVEPEFSLPGEDLLEAEPAGELDDEGPLAEVETFEADEDPVVDESVEEAESPNTWNPVGSFAQMVRQGLGSAAVLAAIATGERDEQALTNRVFFAGHPELGGRALRPDETTLAAEWLRIRDTIVRPLLSGPGGRAPRSGESRQRMTTRSLREAWAADAQRADLMVGVDVLGHRPQVNPSIADAARALGVALGRAGYRADRVGAFSDRVIAGTTRLSLHAYGIAIDIDASHNPHRRGQPGPARWSSSGTQEERRADVAAGRADTSFTADQIAAVRAIRTVDGIPVFFWAGAWRRSPDAMHFQIDVTPAELARGLATTASPGTLEREADGEEADEVDESDDEELDDLEDRGEQEDFSPIDVITSIFRDPTVGFEFDVHYGPIPALPAARNGDVLSTHDHATDGFVVKLDGPRLEVNTRPFETTSSGLKDLQATAARIDTFTAELASGCAKAKTSTPAAFPGAKPFTHPQVTVPIGKLAIGGRFTNCSVWAAPQATITIPLRRVAALVQRIEKTEGGKPGVALTGGKKMRMGLRSEALFRAAREVKKARQAQPFSDDLEGFLILFATYLWTSEVPYRFPAPGQRVDPLVHDYEQIGKAYLPINVKNPFPQVFSTLLSDADQKVFRDSFAVGSARANLFRLALPGGATVSDGTRKFLPPGRTVNGVVDVVHEFQTRKFGFVPTWDDLVEHTLDRTHRGIGDQLWVSHSKPKGIGGTRPRVLLELRRCGFAPVDRSLWGPFMARVHQLVGELDG